MNRIAEVKAITKNPLPTLEEFRKLCYDMKFAIENRVLKEVINKNGAPLECSLDDMFNWLADWAEATTEDYNSAIERGC